jgi:hypothetical protein
MVLVDFAQTCQNFSIWHQKGVDSTYNLSNDLFLVKQLYMGTYVFKICKILEISSWFLNEIMIFEMIYALPTLQWSYRQLIEFWRFVYIMKLYGFGKFRPNKKMSFCTISIYHFENHNFIKKSTRYFQNFTYFENICTHVKLFHEK